MVSRLLNPAYPGRNGQVVTYADGNRYEGEWKDNKMNGYGVLYLADGGRYEGEWHTSERMSLGVQYWADGHFFKGEFTSGTLMSIGEFKGWDPARSTDEW